MPAAEGPAEELGQPALHGGLGLRTVLQTQALVEGMEAGWLKRPVTEKARRLGGGSLALGDSC